MSEPPIESDEPDRELSSESDFVAPATLAHSAEAEPLSYFRAVEQRIEQQQRAGRRGRLSRVPMTARVAVLLFLVVVGAIAIRPVVTGRSAKLPQPTIVPSGISYCEELDREDVRQLEAAIHEMKSVSLGAQLLSVLIENEVCLEVDDLPYNAAYFSGYSGSRSNYSTVWFIVVDRAMVRAIQADELAAILVHEATHAQRFINGLDCEQHRSCTYLQNDILLEEEVAAHRAEAIWWMARHGETGTNTGGSFSGTSISAYLNRLIYEYRQGPAAFEEYVLAIRSGAEEGEGIEPPPFLE